MEINKHIFNTHIFRILHFTTAETHVKTTASLTVDHHEVNINCILKEDESQQVNTIFKIA